jgi:hypothetical protein
MATDGMVKSAGFLRVSLDFRTTRNYIRTRFDAKEIDMTAERVVLDSEGHWAEIEARPSGIFVVTDSHPVFLIAARNRERMMAILPIALADTLKDEAAAIRKGEA